MHFPQFYLIMPQINEFIANYIIEPLFGVMLMGTAVFIIGAKFKNEKSGFGEGLRTAIKTALVVLVFKYGGTVVIPIVQGTSHADFVAYFIIQMLALVATALLIYAVPAVIMHRRGIIGALATTLKLTSKNFIFTFFLLLIPWLIRFPISYLLGSKVYLILGKFNTSVLAYLLSGDLLVSIITGFLTYASVTYFYLSRTE